MNFEAEITKLAERASALDAKLANLADKRKGYSLDATTGDFAAIKEIAKIDADADACRKERQTLSAAIEQLDSLLDAEAAALKRQDREKREAEARKLADGAIAINNEIDATLIRLRQLFERRHDVIYRLGDTKTISSRLISRMLQKFSPTCAARHAGLHNFVSIEHAPPEHVRPLSESNAVLCGNLNAAVDAALEQIDAA